MDFGGFTMAPSAVDMELDQKLYTMLDLEAKRYQNFFATLDENQQRLLPRDTALAFYGKSSLSEQEILDMYDLIKSLQLYPDASAVNETEFITGMHFIVCITKRNLAKLPPTFPKYLFPTLDLTPSSTTVTSNSISSMPSPDKDDMIGGFAGIRLNDNATVAVTSSPSSSMEPTGQMQPLQDAKSLCQLLEKEIHNKRVEATALSKVDESESKALQSLRGCLDLIAENVEKLGFPVPMTARSLEALDDFSNLLRNHVQTMKQEIQSMEISAQMLSIASEASSGSASSTRRESEDPFKEIAALTQQLLALQQQAVQLFQKRETLAKQVDQAKYKKVQQQQPTPLAAKTMDAFGATPPTSVHTPVEMQTAHHVGVTSPTPSQGSTTADGWSGFGSSNAHEVRNSESVQRTDSNPFDAFGGSASPVAMTSVAPASSNDDFNWGSFS
uniref:EH domain-containing protein n=1 Tax=Globisporangium ultimum (strain ATCC 200006 / CBS 805.95 / DAOM BR144) TaxID=431595 RepID=K3XB96_GLOUD